MLSNPIGGTGSDVQNSKFAAEQLRSTELILGEF
jgi:hypothetical protein